MRPLSIAHRWLERRSAKSRPWRQNPWISSPSSTPQPRDDVNVAQKSQQNEAIGNWEDEGGSVRTDGRVRR